MEKHSLYALHLMVTSRRAVVLTLAYGSVMPWRFSSAIPVNPSVTQDGTDQFRQDPQGIRAFA
ncbi:MAG TPA: hypothetical protein PLX03_10420, partial [Candidatus Hydrogenedentes bacterium]|nr:hypothetical protein [Candidatus Hydrogenedentota bacterium]